MPDGQLVVSAVGGAAGRRRRHAADARARKIRYAPTVGLAVPYESRPLGTRNDGRGRRQAVSARQAGGECQPRSRSSIARCPTAVALAGFSAGADGRSIAACSMSWWCSTISSRPSAGVYDWSPAQLDRGKPGSSLGRVVVAAVGRARRRHAAGLSLVGREWAESQEGRRGRQRFVPAGLRADVDRRAVGADQPLAHRRANQLRSDARVRAKNCRTRRPPTPGSAACCWRKITNVDPEFEPRVKRSPSAKIRRRPSIRFSGPATCWSTWARRRESRTRGAGRRPAAARSRRQR